jgi:hypothetical protein
VTPRPPRLALPRRRGFGLMLAAAFAFAGCTSAGSSASPSASTISSPSRAPSAAPSLTVSSTPASGSATSQTDTDWGRIWDTLPPGFPTYPGATPAEEAATGPSSATLVVNGDVSKQVITSMRSSLEAAGFTTTAFSGPLEDGGYVLELRGAADGCAAQVRASPTGGLTTVTILYGAACSHR